MDHHADIYAPRMNEKAGCPSFHALWNSEKQARLHNSRARSIDRQALERHGPQRSMSPVRKFFFALSLLLFALLMCATLAYSGLGQCALCDCKAFAGGKTTNWWCACSHHYDQHYNNRKGPPAGLQSLTLLTPLMRSEGVVCCHW